jgi:hypothetical protein
MAAKRETNLASRMTAWLTVYLIPPFFLMAAIAAPTASAVPAQRGCTPQNRSGENSVLAAKSEFQNAGYLDQYGWSAYIGKSDTPGARQNRVANGLVLGTYVPGVSYIAYPTQYGQNFIPNIGPATSHFGRDPPVRLQPSTVYDGSTRYDGTSGFSLAAESTTAQIAAPTGDSYSVAFQTELKSTSYPGALRPAHFQEANENLLQMMESDPQFAQQMQEAGVNLQRTPTGLVPRTSPAGWTWHHAQEPGMFQLVPRWQHTPSSIFWDTLHPGGQGSYAIWGQQ